MATLPSGFDRGDGVAGRVGTPTPAAARIVSSYAGGGAVTVEELPDSPRIERGEQATLVHRTRHDWADAVTRIYTLGRGVVRTDSQGILTKILSTSLEHEKGDTGVLTVTEEGLSFDLPPDQFQITPVELGVNIMKHPRYFYAFLGDGQGSTTEQLNQMVIRMLQNYFENTTSQYRDAISKLLYDSLGSNGTTTDVEPKFSGTKFKTTDKITGTDIAKYAAMEIVQKYWRGEETPYIVGYQATWSRFYRLPQVVNPGGYIESPIAQATPALPDYFYSPTDPVSAITIFDYLHVYNPQCFSTTGRATGATSISWLRKSDQQEFDRTLYKMDRTWLGAPIGHWDEQLYNRNRRPEAATASSDYTYLKPPVLPT